MVLGDLREPAGISEMKVGIGKIHRVMCSYCNLCPSPGLEMSALETREVILLCVASDNCTLMLPLRILS